MFSKKEACTCLVVSLSLSAFVFTQHPVSPNPQTAITVVPDGRQLPLSPLTPVFAAGPTGLANLGTPVLIADGPQPPPPPPKSVSTSLIGSSNQHEAVLVADGPQPPPPPPKSNVTSLAGFSTQQTPLLIADGPQPPPPPPTKSTSNAAAA